MSRVGWIFVSAVLFVVAPVAASASPARTGTAEVLTPAALLRALATMPILNAALPAGLTDATAVTRHDLTPTARKNHAVGLVQVFFKGTGYASIAFEVFPT